MTKSKSIDFNDARMLLRLIGEVSDLPTHDCISRQKHLIKGLCDHLGAKVGLFIEAVEYHPGQIPQIVSVVQSGTFENNLSWQTREQFMEMLDGDPLVEASFRSKAPALVIRRRDRVTNKQWYSGAHFSETARPAGVDDVIHARTGLTPDALGGGIGIHRELGDRAFTPRDRTVIELLMAVLPAIYHLFRTTPDVQVRKLPPSLQRVLRCLVRGDSIKQAAYSLDLSFHTVHGYTKELHRHFNVSTRSELLLKVLGGNRKVSDTVPDPSPGQE